MINNFKYAISLAQMLYDIDINDMDTLIEIGLGAYNFIGNKNTQLSSEIVNVDRRSGLVKLPCKADLVEAITGTVEEEFIRRQNERIVHEVIDAMQEPNRTIFILRYFYFYKVKEIASYLKLKEDNVESRLRRGKKQLQDRLLSKGILYRSKEGKKRKWKGKGETAENGG